MPLTKLLPNQLRLTIDPAKLGFVSTQELVDEPLPWIGQERAEKAARFGLSIDQPGYNLFVLGAVGSGKSSLMAAAMQTEAAKRPTPPDLCYLHNFDAPETPIALRLTAGQGRALRDGMADMTKTLCKEILASIEAGHRLQPQQVESLLAEPLQSVRDGMAKEIENSPPLKAYLDAVEQDLLNHTELFESDETSLPALLQELFAKCQVNLAVDNASLVGAPALLGDVPLYRSLFGSIEYQVKNDLPASDFSRVRAGSLMQAHGGFLLLHLRDLLGDPQVWDSLRRFLRNGRPKIEDPGAVNPAAPLLSLEPEVLDADVKIILIGSREQYYNLQDEDAEFGRYFRIKVDFAESFKSGENTHRASAIFIAHCCQRCGLPHFSAAAVARLLEEMHRKVDDQTRQYAVFAALEQMIIESAVLAPKDGIVDAGMVEQSLQASAARHDYPDQLMRESILEGERVIAVQGERIGRINGLSHIDLGDQSFGMPVVVSARTFPGKEGVLNIAREVEMSGPIHDKGMFILQTYFATLFAHQGPLSLNGALVFEQEYHGVEGDSASCAELYALLSSLSGLPIRQGIAVTGALNQFGEVLPVGGLNEKIEGFFRVCRETGLDGTQGVVLPSRNRCQLMLNHEVMTAVAQEQFHIYIIDDVTDALPLLMGEPAGEQDARGRYSTDSVLGEAQDRLIAFRRICHQEEHAKSDHKSLYKSS